MSANIHPPMLTDLVTTKLYESHEAFFHAQGVTHADLNNVMNTWIVMAIFIIAVLAMKKLEMIPRGLQNFWEVTVRTLEDLVVETMGEEGRPYFPFIATLALFILTCNLIGIIPYLQSSTNNLNTTLALALTSFVMTHRDHRPLEQDTLTELPSFREHHGRGSGDRDPDAAGTLAGTLADDGIAGVHLFHSDPRVHHAGHDVHCGIA